MRTFYNRDLDVSLRATCGHRARGGPEPEGQPAPGQPSSAASEARRGPVRRPRHGVVHHIHLEETLCSVRYRNRDGGKGLPRLLDHLTGVVDDPPPPPRTRRGRKRRHLHGDPSYQRPPPPPPPPLR